MAMAGVEPAYLSPWPRRARSAQPLSYMACSLLRFVRVSGLFWLIIFAWGHCCFVIHRTVFVSALFVISAHCQLSSWLLVVGSPAPGRAFSRGNGFPAAGDSLRNFVQGARTTIRRGTGTSSGLISWHNLFHRVHNRTKVNRCDCIKRVIAKANGYFVDLVKTFES